MAHEFKLNDDLILAYLAISVMSDKNGCQGWIEIASSLLSLIGLSLCSYYLAR